MERYSQKELHKYKTSLEALGKRALRQVRVTFGPSIDIEAIKKGDPRSAIKPKGRYPFHSLLHSTNTGNTAAALATHLRLSPLLVAVARTAGYTHDVIREGTLNGNDERESARWFVEQARDLEIPNELQKIGQLAILGTIPQLRNFMLVGQHVNQLSFDRTPKQAELIARIVASADLGELFQPTGPLMSRMLHYEILGRQPTIDESIKFQTTQARMVHTYKHPLPQAAHLLTPFKQEVQDHTARTLQALKTGRIATWDTLIRHDAAFMQRENIL